MNGREKKINILKKGKCFMQKSEKLNLKEKV